MADPVELQEALVVRPGDRLLIRVSRDTPVEDLGELLEQLRQRFPEVEVTIVAADQLAVVRGEEAGPESEETGQ